MRDLLVFLHEIQTFRENGIVFVLVLPYLHQNFDHILDSLADRAFVENSTETFEHSGIGFWRVFGQECADFPGETDGNLDGVVCGPFEKQDKDLKSNYLVRDRLVDEMRYERSSRIADNLRRA